MNLKNYYTEKETQQIIAKNPKSRRSQLNAVKIYNRWWYPRIEASTMSDRKHFKNVEPIDLDTTKWVNLSGIKQYWPFSRERLYQLSIRLDSPRIKYRNINGQNLFNIASITSYINEK